MKKNLPKSVFIVFVILSVLLVFVLTASLLSYSADISYNPSLEVGDEIIVRFPKWVPKGIALRSFQIDPISYGQLVWVDQFKELHYVPDSGFHPSQSYRVSISLKLSLFAQLLPLSDMPQQNKLNQLLPVTNTQTFKTTPKQVERVEALPQIADGKYVDVNLKTMLMTLYQNGRVVGIFPIAGKGNPVSAPTIEGTFRVLNKETNHFSSISHVWMPYSIQFFGDYFIHEWPYWPNGARIKSKFSLGCVRLHEGNSEKLYNFVEIGTPVVVHSLPEETVLTPR